MELSAHRITVRWDEDLLVAESGPLQPPWPAEGTEEVELPKLVDAGQVVEGVRMEYNLKTRRGRVIQGTTKYEDGTTHGEIIKKTEPEVLFIRASKYTTCDAEPPHYHFWSRDLKLIVKNKVVARPVVLFFGPVPVMVIPFAVFPARGGRHSGLIVPTYGESADQGRYLRNLGYYWAPNDYVDVKSALDFYERFGVLFRGDAQYVKRYRFSGNLSGSFNNQRREGQARGYDLVFNHRHTLSPSANLTVSGQYVSNRRYRQELSLNPWERMRRTLRSDATLSKTWPGTPYSGSVNLHFEEDLQSGEETRVVPRLGLSRAVSPLIPQAAGAPADSARWFNRIYWGYRLGMENQRRVRAVERTIYTPGAPPTTTFSLEPPRYLAGAQQDLTVSSSQKVFRYFAATPSLTISQAWLDRWYEYRRRSDGSVDTVKHDQWRPRHTFGAGMGLGTKLYGLFRLRMGGLEAVRHTLTPSVSFNYRPDFSEPRWGIYQRFQDAAGREDFYDRFAGTLYPSPGRGKTQSLGINLDNLFQYKALREGKEVKGDLFSVNLSTSYNLAADSLKWGDLSSSMQVSPLRRAAGGMFSAVSGLTVRLNASHSFYDVHRDPNTGQAWPVNRFYPGGLRLENFDLSSSFKVVGGGKRGVEADTAARETGDRFDNPIWRPSPVPWEAGVAFHFGERFEAGTVSSKSIWANLNLEIQATANWKLGYNTRLDMHNRRVVSSNLTLYRDLHCWEGRFTWNPTGVGRGYYLIIAIKSPQLRDIKVERQKGSGSAVIY